MISSGFRMISFGGPAFLPSIFSTNVSTERAPISYFFWPMVVSSIPFIAVNSISLNPTMAISSGTLSPSSMHCLIGPQSHIVIRRKDGGWRFCHSDELHSSPVAGLLQKIPFQKVIVDLLPNRKLARASFPPSSRSNPTEDSEDPPMIPIR